jgi:microcystin degradation protein MlrC
MTRRLFTACLGTETNSFSPIPTGLSVFEGRCWCAAAHGERPSCSRVPLMRWREQAQALGWTVVEGLAAFADAGRRHHRATHEALRDEILADLRARCRSTRCC